MAAIVDANGHHDFALEQALEGKIGAADGDDLADHSIASQVEHSFVEPTEATENEDTTADASEVVGQSIPDSRGLYFVRIPKPHFDDTNVSLDSLKKELQAQITALKAYNSKLQAKRTEVSELRRQLNAAWSLKDGSAPEFEEKMARLKHLRELRSSYTEQITAIKTGVKGLDCRSEEELEQRIHELEQQIQHEQLPLRVEKQTVQNISKLKAQREQIKQYEGQRSNLGDLEAEVSKLKGVIAELDEEFKILQGERQQAQSIARDLQAKLKEAQKGLSELDAERQEVETRKKEIQDQLTAAREESLAQSQEYNENRKLSLTIRELVEKNAVEEATKLVEAQVEQYVTKLNADADYRREYVKLWSEQRKYIVAEVLPNSGTPADHQASGRQQGGIRAPPPERLIPQGAAKAKAIIEAALQEAGRAVAALGKVEPDSEESAPASVTDEEETADAPSKPAEPVRRIVPGATDDLSVPAAPKIVKQHKPQNDYARIMAELPKVEVDYEFVPPVRAEAEKLSEQEIKERVREENRLKAQEAEARKKKRQEQQAKKKQKVLQQQQKANEVPNSKFPKPTAAEAVRMEDVSGASGTDGEAEVPEQAAELPAAAAAVPVVSHRAAAPVKSGAVAAPAKTAAAVAKAAVVSAKRPPVRVEKNILKKVQKWAQQNQVALGVGGFLAVLLAILIMYINM